MRKVMPLEGGPLTETGSTTGIATNNPCSPYPATPNKMAIRGIYHQKSVMQSLIGTVQPLARFRAKCRTFPVGFQLLLAAHLLWHRSRFRGILLLVAGGGGKTGKRVGRRVVIKFNAKGITMR